MAACKLVRFMDRCSRSKYYINEFVLCCSALMAKQISESKNNIRTLQPSKHIVENALISKSFYLITLYWYMRRIRMNFKQKIKRIYNYSPFAVRVVRSLLYLFGDERCRLYGKEFEMKGVIS